VSRHTAASGIQGRSMELRCNVCGPPASEVHALPMELRVVTKLAEDFNARHAHPEMTCDGRLEWLQLAGILVSREVEGGGHVIDGRCPKCGWEGTASPKSPRKLCGRHLEEASGADGGGE
jgi:hypothetical protein